MRTRKSGIARHPRSSATGVTIRGFTQALHSRERHGAGQGAHRKRDREEEDGEEGGDGEEAGGSKKDGNRIGQEHDHICPTTSHTSLAPPIGVPAAGVSP